MTESDPSPFDDLNESASHVDQTLAATGGKRPGQLLLTTQSKKYLMVEDQFDIKVCCMFEVSSHVAAPFLISTDDSKFERGLHTN